MKKLAEIIIFICNWVACFTLYGLLLAFTNLLIREKVLVFVYPWVEWVIYFGLGVLVYHPVKYILNHNPKKN